MSSEEGARLAYVGLHDMIGRALNLGMLGYNAASSANIPEQSGEGDVSGTITISGQVDQGASDNKGMRLYIALVDYEDTLEDDEAEAEDAMIQYDTAAEALPFLELMLRDLPGGTFSGELNGSFTMMGDLEGDVTLSVVMAGDIEEVAGSAGDIRLVPGTTQITGTASSDYGTYDVDLAL